MTYPLHVGIGKFELLCSLVLDLIRYRDPYFSRTSLLDGETRFYYEKLIFEKLESSLILFILEREKKKKKKTLCNSLF